MKKTEKIEQENKTEDVINTGVELTKWVQIWDIFLKKWIHYVDKETLKVLKTLKSVKII